MLVRAVLTAASWGCETAIDVGSGDGRYRALVPHCETVDAYQDAPLSDFHHKANALQLLSDWEEAPYWDLVYALDVIEHLTKADGLKLLDQMERLARKRVLIFTPNGYRKQTSDIPWQIHRSGWTAEELRARGYWTAVTDFDYEGKVEPAAALWAVKECR